MKRILALLLSLSLLLSLHFPAFAGDVFSQYTSELPGEVAIHCSEEALNMISTEDLARLIEMTKYSIEPQAAELLRTGFPAFEEAARMNQLGTQIGLEILYDDEANTLAAVAWDDGLDTEGGYGMRYKIYVTAKYLAEEDAAGNPVMDPKTGKLRLTTDRGRLTEYCSTITHELMHAFMADYNRTGMQGYIDPQLVFLPAYASQEEADAAIAHYEAVTLPRWFTEGCATAVENEYAYRRTDFERMRDFVRAGSGEWYTPEDLQYAFAATALDPGLNLEEMEELPLTFDLNVNIYVTGYLATLYLAELAANSEGVSACSFGSDGLIRVDSAVLRSGLDDILRMLHTGATLDDIVYSISEGRFYDTADFEYGFVVDDYDSAEFCSFLLNYMLRLSREDGRRYLPNGSILFPFDMDYDTQIDPAKEAESGLYRIVDSRDYVKSTADLSYVTDAGKSLSCMTYWNGAMPGTEPAFDYDRGSFVDPAYAY